MFDSINIETVLAVLIPLVTIALGWIAKNKNAELGNVKDTLLFAEDAIGEIKELVEDVNEALKDDKVDEAEFTKIFNTLKRLSRNIKN